jgi:hypothetical protein
MKIILVTIMLCLISSFKSQTSAISKESVPYVFCDHLRGTFQIETNTRLPLSIHIKMCDLITEKRHPKEVVRFVYNDNITLVIIPQTAIDNKEFISKEIVYVK